MRPRRRAEGPVRHITADAAETERIGEIAAQALSDIHTAIYGQPPAGGASLVDGDAILLVMRLAPRSPHGRRATARLDAADGPAAVERRTAVPARSLDQRGPRARARRARVRTRAAAAVPEPQTDRAPAGPVRGAG